MGFKPYIDGSLGMAFVDNQMEIDGGDDHASGTYETHIVQGGVAWMF